MKHFTATFYLLLITVQAAAAQVASVKPVLGLNDAKEIMQAAVVYARDHNAPGGAIAIVDDGGDLVLLERLDDTFAAAPAIATGKARTAAMFRKPTRDFEKLVNEGRTTMVTLPEITWFTPLQGGVPIKIAEHVVGAIGVSGAASAQQDDEIAQAAIDFFAANTQASAVTEKVITFVDAAAVKQAFAKGAPLVENHEFKVHASRRDSPGEAEIHKRDTDIFYVQEGSARFVTGGELIAPRTVAPGEIRGTAIKGGMARSLKKGDVMVIPSGVPHWFQRVSPPFVYYVVKSTG
jgi:glc operon protein GlcG